eukprot:UN32951
MKMKREEFHERMETYLLAGVEFVRHGLQTPNAADLWKNFATFFHQTYDLGLTLKKESSASGKHNGIGQNILYLCSICLDCEGVLLREITLIRSDHILNVGSKLKSNLCRGLTKRKDSSLPNNIVPTGRSETPGSNPPDQKIDICDDIPVDFVEHSMDAVASIKRAQESYELRKTLDICTLNQFRPESTEGLRAKDTILC